MLHRLKLIHFDQNQQSLSLKKKKKDRERKREQIKLIVFQNQSNICNEPFTSYPREKNLKIL